MPELDTIVAGGKLVTGGGVRRADLGIADGRIAAISDTLDASSAEMIAADGLWVLPGVIDAHVHLNDPGRTSWEGWETGTRALAVGGTTTALDMPVNSLPPTTTARAFEAKRAAAEGTALIDFGLWGGLQPDNLFELEPLHSLGAVGFKAFMCTTGLDEFVCADDLALYEGMAEAARLGALVAVHAENDAITGGLAARARSEGRRGVRDFLASRPIVSELEAIGRAVLMAEQTGCALHVVHVSCGEGLALIAEARARGVDVTCETCTHYLVLTDDDVERLGAVAKCTPPLRDADERELLWHGLSEGTLPMVSSDHSPAAPELKTGDDFLGIWGGISGCQSMLELLVSEGHHRRGLAIELLVEAVTGFVARRFRLPAKGALRVGTDADLVLFAPDDERVISADELLYRHPVSPYVGRMVRGRVVQTVVRGITVARDGRPTSRPIGRLIAPAAAQTEVSANVR